MFREKDGMVIAGIASILWIYSVLMETGWSSMRRTGSQCVWCAIEKKYEMKLKNHYHEES